MSQRGLEWYARRISKMSAREIGWRARDIAHQRAWARRQVLAGSEPGRVPGLVGEKRSFTAVLPPETRTAIPPTLRDDLCRAADEIVAGRGEILGVERPDLADPDWFFDPATGQHAPDRALAFSIDHRSEAVTGNVKQVWELSRLHHVTLLAAAWYAGGKDEHAEAAARQLRSWWAANPFLSGVNWTSGIEAGVRLVSFVWIRRLLDGWEGAPGLFEENPGALAQIRWHQEYLEAFRSRGSSANNHVVAEAAGQLIASRAFPWFEESRGWGDAAATLLEAEVEHNTFPSGLDREQATSYHRFVCELGLAAAVEAGATGQPLGGSTWQRLVAMLDAAAAILDSAGRPPRQGDGDDGRALVVEPPSSDPWASLLATGAALAGSLSWWPATAPTVLSVLLGSLAGTRALGVGGLVGAQGAVASSPLGAPLVRQPERPSHFADAGCTILRGGRGEAEIWCRCDGGQHGFLSIAAHAHADALSIELRHGGVDILADPGTYCYHGEAEWRRYFRSTLGHNTIELAGEDQSVSGGPFLWLRAARTTAEDVSVDPSGGNQVWSASHDGYERLDPPARHHRRVVLSPEDRTLEVRDRVDTNGLHALRLAFHLGPLVDCELTGNNAALHWPSCGGTATARVELPPELSWTAHREEKAPIFGWYSCTFGQMEPAVTLLGTGRTRPGGTVLRTVVSFLSTSHVAGAGDHG